MAAVRLMPTAPARMLSTNMFVLGSVWNALIACATPRTILLSWHVWFLRSDRPKKSHGFFECRQADNLRHLSARRYVGRHIHQNTKPPLSLLGMVIHPEPRHAGKLREL